jgi:L-histidine Nalpha-methyltransferase
MTTSTTTGRVHVDRHRTDADTAAELAADVRAGLTAAQKTLPPKWFYDAVGSELFEEITRLDEYYPTRREREVLVAHAPDIAARTRARTLVELGSGSSEKTRLLLDALLAEGTLERYVPVDVSDSALVSAVDAVAADYPQLEVHGVVADFVEHLDLLPGGPSRLVAFLGGTIGNFEPGPRADYLRRVAGSLRPGGAFLLGTDLVKDAGRLVRAYDDANGVTAAFNLNVLAVVNRELGADFDVAGFRHVARWDAGNDWIEMHLESVRDQTVHVTGLGLDAHFAAGESVRTEISAKFTRDRVATEYADAGLHLADWWTDSADDYAMSLAVPSAHPQGAGRLDRQGEPHGLAPAERARPPLGAQAGDQRQPPTAGPVA